MRQATTRSSSAYRFAVLLAAACACSAQAPRPESARPEVERAVARMVAAGGDVRVRRARVGGLPRFVSMGNGPGIALSTPPGAGPEERTQAFLAQHGQAFGLGADKALRVTRVAPPDGLGREHVRVQQTHRGIPISGAELAVHLKGDHVVAANGISLDAAELSDLDLSPTLTAAQAQDAARDLVAGLYRVAEPQAKPPRLEIFNRGLFSDTNTSSHLAWFVAVSAPEVFEQVWVDAHSGTILLHFDQAPTALRREVWNAGGTKNDPPAGTLVRREGGAPSGDAEVDAAYDALGLAYEYFLAEHERDGVDDRGQKIVAIARYDLDNAQWVAEKEWIRVGSGWTQPDILAHELTHGIDNHTAGLIYFEQAGALAEAFGDIFGETVDLASGTGTTRWIWGEGTGRASSMRNLRDPESSPRPLPGKTSSERFACTYDDGGGVHTNSAVLSHAYTLMVDGGDYNGRTITGIGLTKAAKVVYRALTTYLVPVSRFADADEAIRQSCTDLVGTAGITTTDCKQVGLALDAVELATWPCTMGHVRVEVEGTGTGSALFDTEYEVLRCRPGTPCDFYFTIASSMGPSSMGVRAEPDAGSAFIGWSGDCSGRGDCSLDRKGDHTVHARFDLPTPGISTRVEETSRSGDDYCARVTVSNGSGAAVTGWAGLFLIPGGEHASITSADFTYGRTPRRNPEVAVFPPTGDPELSPGESMRGQFCASVTIPPMLDLQVLRAGTGGGTVTSTPAGIDCGADCSEKVVAGNPVTLVATAAPGSVFDGWSGGGCYGLGTCVITSSGAATVTATFTRRSHRLDVTLGGTGNGTVVSSEGGIYCGVPRSGPYGCAAMYDEGTVVTLSATANPYTSEFVGWTGEVCSGVTGPCTFTMDRETEVTAQFKRVKGYLRVNRTGSGSGNVSWTPNYQFYGDDYQFGYYPLGSTVTLAAVAGGGSGFAGWTGACAGAGMNPSCTVSVVEASATAYAAFERTATCTPNFTVAPLPNHQTGNFNSTAQVCFVVQSALPLFFNCSEMSSRTVTVNGTLYLASACNSAQGKKVKLPVTGDGRYTFDVSPGSPTWSSISFWNE